MSEPNPLLSEIEAFLGHPKVDMTETAFGIAALNDGKFVPTLRAGRRVWPETQERVRNFIAGERARLGIKAVKTGRAA